MTTIRTALVAGGTGFIGSEPLRPLVAPEGKVIVLDKFATGRRENLGGVPAAVLQGGVRDFRVPAGVSAVFHLAYLGVRHSLHAPTT
jgi:UDP-glucose 4-epimerase